MEELYKCRGCGRLFKKEELAYIIQRSDKHDLRSYDPIFYCGLCCKNEVVQKLIKEAKDR